LTPKIHWLYSDQGNAFVKFDSQGSMGCWAIDRELFLKNKVNVTIPWLLDPKINRGQDQCTYAVWRPRSHELSSYWSETVFTYKVNITFDPLTPKLTGVIYRTRPMHLWSLKVKASWVVKLLIGNHFDIQGQFDLDLWPKGPKNNRGHLLVMNNPHTKLEVPKPKHSLVIDQKPFGQWTNRLIDRQMQSNIPPLIWRGA
jgi:hypothetical protein